MSGRMSFLALMLAVVSACRDRDHDAGGVTAPSDASAPPSTNGIAVVPNGAWAPFGVTWVVGFGENVRLAALEGWHARISALSASLWNVTEGQVFVERVLIADNLAPGLTANTLAYGSPPPVVDKLDMMVFVGQTWDVRAGGFVVVGGRGREGRIIGVPESVGDLVMLHEGSHMIFRLSWSPGPLLWDEYVDGTQDGSCIMDLAFSSPLRWCAGDNHVGQSSQPTSCWEQVLADYPSFAFAGTHKAGTPVPPTEVEFSDAP